MAKGMNRDRRREAQWRRMISEQGISGLSIREFCRKANLSESAFYFWRHELQRRNAEHASATTNTTTQEPPRPARSVAAPAFVPVRVDQRNAWNDQNDPASGHHNGTEYRIEIVLPGGYRVHVTAPIDRQALADVLRGLRLDALDSSIADEITGLPSAALANEGRRC